MTQPTAHDDYIKALRYGAMCQKASAFPIKDHELACWWAGLATPAGYRVAVSMSGRHGGELILVHLPGQQSPAFAIQPLSSAVTLIDCLGMTMRFPTLLDALLTLAPVPKPSRSELIRGARPRCINSLPDFPKKRNLASCRAATAIRTTLN